MIDLGLGIWNIGKPRGKILKMIYLNRGGGGLGVGGGCWGVGMEWNFGSWRLRRSIYIYFFYFIGTSSRRILKL